MRNRNTIWRRSGVTGLIMLAVGASAVAQAADWIAAPSYFTHDPQTGQRVTQFAPIGPFHVQGRSDYRRSLYRQSRSSIQAGDSADHMHIVEEYGRPIRPYGEWRFPYRPYSVPYPAWGPPFAGLGGVGYGYGGYGHRGGYGGGFGAGAGNGLPDPYGPLPRRVRDGVRDGSVRPYQDGRYPVYRTPDRNPLPNPFIPDENNPLMPNGRYRQPPFPPPQPQPLPAQPTP